MLFRKSANRLKRDNITVQGDKTQVIKWRSAMDMSKIPLGPNILVASPIQNGTGSTFTVATVLGLMLDLAEERYGVREDTYFFVGVEFDESGPLVWYPRPRDVDRQHIAIKLSLGGLHVPKTAMFELSHEVVHLLSPTGNELPASNLEEGLATVFQVSFMREYFKENFSNNLGNYVECYQRTRKFLEGRPDAVKTLRQKEHIIDNIAADLIRAEFPEVSDYDAKFLGGRFPY